MNTTRGFTLIELLLVISMIALISSVVLTSFETGRRKAQDAAVKRQLIEMRNLMYRELSDNGSYANLKANSTTGEVSSAEDCPTVGVGASNLRGTYAAQFRNACLGVKSTQRNQCGTGDVCITFYRPTGALNDRKFSIAAYLPHASREAGGDRFFCVGSNGRISADGTSAFSQSGCPNDASL